MRINEDLLESLVELEEYVGNLGKVTGDSLVIYNKAGKAIAKAKASKRLSAAKYCEEAFRQVPEAKAYKLLDELTHWHEVGRYQ
jgi:hypothetical protein